MQIREALTYDDVLLQPKYSEIKSRSEVDLSVKLPKGIELANPIIPANMATVTGKVMAKCIADMGGLAIVHRFMPIEDQLEMINDFELMTEEGTVDYLRHIGFSVGVKEEDYVNVKDLITLGAHIICIDVAHGDSKLCVDMCQYISKEFPEVLLIAGNVATGEGAKRLWRAGADLVKIGVGSGSLCTTRIETGNGVPQLTALIDVAKTKKELVEDYDDCKYIGKIKKNAEITRPIGIISDGGASHNGDLVKALCFADMVMAGNIFAGCTETPGEIIELDGVRYKSYVGSSTHKTSHIEGVQALMRTKGSAKEIMRKLLEGVRSGCSYQGVSNLVDLKKDPHFVKITNAGLKESHPHDTHIIKG